MITVNTPTGEQSIVNPLYNYTFHPLPLGTDFPTNQAVSIYLSMISFPLPLPGQVVPYEQIKSVEGVPTENVCPAPDSSLKTLGCQLLDKLSRAKAEPEQGEPALGFAESSFFVQRQAHHCIILTIKAQKLI